MGQTAVPKRRQEITTTLCNNPEEHSSQLLRGKSVKLHEAMKSLRKKKTFLKYFYHIHMFNAAGIHID
jgi:hypothetical protein